MAKDFDLIAELREDQGKGASRRLRHQGKVPAIIYGAGRPPRSLTFDHNKVIRQLENESLRTSSVIRPSRRSCTWISSASSKTRRSG
jgi:large subunit ribosomal protein L25